MTLASARPTAHWTTVERAIGCFVITTLAVLLLLVGERHAVGETRSMDPITLLALRHAIDRTGPGWSGLREFMLSVTALGAFPTLAIVVCGVTGLLTSLGRGTIAIRLLLAAGSGVGCANLLKHLIGRPRPEVVAHWVPVSSSSFPSGHSADGAVIYLLLACLAGRLVSSRAAERFIAAFALVLVLLIGASRLYLGVHWPSDVLGGWCFGAAWALAATPFVLSASGPIPARHRHSGDALGCHR